jgi:hypothetical protein
VTCYIKVKPPANAAGAVLFLLLLGNVVELKEDFVQRIRAGRAVW